MPAPVRYNAWPRLVIRYACSSYPGAWSVFLDDGKSDASCLGPLAGLEKQRVQYEAALDALAGPLRTRMGLVARAQAATLREAARTHDELTAIGLSPIPRHRRPIARHGSEAGSTCPSYP